VDGNVCHQYSLKAAFYKQRDWPHREKKTKKEGSEIAIVTVVHCISSERDGGRGAEAP
jgi:hypothetical protein